MRIIDAHLVCLISGGRASTATKLAQPCVRTERQPRPPAAFPRDVGGAWRTP